MIVTNDQYAIFHILLGLGTMLADHSLPPNCSVLGISEYWAKDIMMQLLNVIEPPKQTLSFCIK